MSEETRLILEKLETIDAGMKELRGDVQELKSDVSELKTDVAVLKSDVAGLKSDVQALDYRVDKLEKNQIELKMVYENELRKNINTIAEGHAYLKQKLEEAVALQRDKERMELDISALKMDMHNVKLKIGLA